MYLLNYGLAVKIKSHSYIFLIKKGREKVATKLFFSSTYYLKKGYEQQEYIFNYCLKNYYPEKNYSFPEKNDQVPKSHFLFLPFKVKINFFTIYSICCCIWVVEFLRIIFQKYLIKLYESVR